MIAQLVGTWDLLDDDDRAWLKGTIVNKFRGDPTLFDSGLTVITDRTGLPCFGVVPHFDAARRLPAEDAVAVDTYRAKTDRPIKIAVPVLPRIANFDDLDPLIAEPDVTVELVRSRHCPPRRRRPHCADRLQSRLSPTLPLCAPRAGISTFRRTRRRGGAVLGLCGGYQMLGRSIGDPRWRRRHAADARMASAFSILKPNWRRQKGSPR